MSTTICHVQWLYILISKYTLYKEYFNELASSYLKPVNKLAERFFIRSKIIFWILNPINHSCLLITRNCLGIAFLHYLASIILCFEVNTVWLLIILTFLRFCRSFFQVQQLNFTPDIRHIFLRSVRVSICLPAFIDRLYTLLGLHLPWCK
jgi:hypothetical protein